MKIIGLTYADDKMTQSAELCKQSMEKNGVHFAWVGEPKFIDTQFKLTNRDIFKENGRGAGCYWLFKPYCIEYVMRDLKDGDILIYSDAGVEFINPVHEIINRMDQDIFFFTNGFPHAEWCKWDCINAINNWQHCFNENKEDPGGLFLDIKQFTQVQASVIFFKVNQNTRNFVKEWLLWCQMPGFIDDSPSKLPNYPTFAEHRHDQAILTCLQIKYGYKLHFWPTAYSEHIRHTAQPEDNYPTMFNHHRKRDPGKGDGQPEW